MTVHEEATVQLRLNPGQQALQEELRDYFARLMTPERRDALNDPSGEVGRGDAYRDVVRQLGDDGWLALGWPQEYGGQDRTTAEQLIFADEAAVAGVPIPFLTINSVAPTIMKFGSPEQKSEFLPRIAAGRLHFSIGYSEPGAGTDLAALSTRAVKDGGEYVVNGQKMWTSLIQYADYIWLAVRTDMEARKHRGLSVLIVPADADGFSWSPVPTMAGVTTSATYFHDVRVPVSARVGDENAGWPLITNQLNHERVSLTSSGGLGAALADVRAWAAEAKAADGSRVLDAEWVRLALARVHAQVEALRLMNARIAWQADHDEQLTPAAASGTKVYGTELATEAYRSPMEVLGAGAVVRRGSPGALLAGRLERMHRAALILTFGGGTNEVQRDIVAATGLGVPVGAR